jgi:hypothetical protein
MSSKKKKDTYITIKDERIKVYIFDTPYSLLERFSLQVKPQKQPDQFRRGESFILQTLPSFLRFEQEFNTIIEIKENENYRLEDIRNIRDMSFDLFIKSVKSLSKNYQQLSPKDITLIYFIERGYSLISIDDFSKIYEENNMHDALQENEVTTDRSFTNARITYISMGKYVANNALLFRKLQYKVKSEENVYNELSSIQPVELSEFVVEGTTEEITLEFQFASSLYQVFDMLCASQTMPFIVFSDGNTLFYKIYKFIRPIAEWLDITHRSDSKPVIYFYVLDTQIEENQMKLAKHVDGDVYRGGMWITEDYKTHTIRVDSRGAVTYVHEFLDNLSESTKDTQQHFNIVWETQYETRGKFSVLKEPFNKAIFADLITNDPIFSNLLYLDENSKSVLDKKRFVYYHDSKVINPVKLTDNQSLTITMSDVITESEVRTDIRISRASTEIQIHQFMILFSYLFGMYLKKKNGVIDIYTKLYKAVNFKKYEKKIIHKATDIKTGKRLKLLEQHNPEAFKHGGYSSKCQPKRRQPYLVAKTDIDKVKKEFRKAEPKELAKELEKYGLLEWPEGSDDWYACYPREQDDDEKRHIWPGLIKQSEKASNYDKYPLLPCCFIANQFTKKGSKKAEKVEVDEYTEDQFDRPLSSNKPTPRGRYAELPYYIQIAVENAGYTPVEYRKKLFLPILRYGVIEGLDSVVHCMEKAFNEDYAAMNINDKMERVKSVLASLSEKDDEWLVICRQEMYDYSYDEIRKSLANPNTYIDPDKYINIFAKHYDCNIIVFKIDDENPKGEISLPRYSKAHLSYKFNPKTETVVIVKMQSKRARVGSVHGLYQCELVVKYDKGKVDFMFDSKDKFILKCFEILSKIVDVYIVSPDQNYIKYDPQILL